jgi:hypothetical protein
VFYSTRHHGVFYSTRHHCASLAARGKGCYKRLNPTAANVPSLSLVAAVTAAAAAVSRAAFRFPKNLKDWIDCSLKLN